MSREATTWAHGPDVLKLNLAANELVFLRLICWKIRRKPDSVHPIGMTPPLSGEAIARLTDIKSPTTQQAIRMHLRELGLIVFERANKLPEAERPQPKPGGRTPTEFVYSLGRGAIRRKGGS